MSLERVVSSSKQVLHKGKEWLFRYGPGEATGLAAGITAYIATKNGTDNTLLASYALSTAWAVAFSVVFTAQHYIIDYVRTRRAGEKYSFRQAIDTGATLATECLPVGLANSFVVRPLLTAYFANQFGQRTGLTAGLTLSHAFYLTGVIAMHEWLNRRSARRAALPAVKTVPQYSVDEF